MAKKSILDEQGYVEDLYQDAIASVVDDYPLEWKLLQEPLQNAIDSFIDVNSNCDFQAPSKQPGIEITMDLKNDRITIRDYGIGIPHANWKMLFKPHKSSKKSIQKGLNTNQNGN